jgi:hypothetical protein
MNEPNNLNDHSEGLPHRPTWLSALCILTFIGSGVSSVSFLMVYLSYEEALPLMQEFGSMFPGMELLATAGKNFFITGFVLYFLSVMGASLMWRLQKIGFHFYVASQILLVILPVIYIKSFPFPIIEAMITAGFIFFYSRFLKLMT